MREALGAAKRDGVTHVIFGDLFLEDIRAYREERLAPEGLVPVFPLWRRDTQELARDMLAAGMSARITCVDPRVLGASFAGRVFDAELLRDLPANVDPCGENGEFHTFVTAGPMFEAPIAVTAGRDRHSRRVRLRRPDAGVATTLGAGRWTSRAGPIPTPTRRTPLATASTRRSRSPRGRLACGW